ncbi:hypothetical protein [Bosea psychrotolerans]|uniref:DUF4145 domain-containing protein n=1 Tax=Bosea psychrotolerans TaxID=1871628 RepID=A0A2S4M3Q0_9HYPH|nr:hypothetical protein [Bosea psychrotolerans]POR49336.1 hypothetical protein CYD53_112161 [Bosea psychrotolerans]
MAYLSSDDDQADLFSEVADLSLVRFLLADLHDDLQGKVKRFRFLTDLGALLGPRGTMIYGGHIAYNAWAEARSSFVHGNYVATVLLCQSLTENLLAAFLEGGFTDRLPERVKFDETLRRCQAQGLLDDQDIADLKQLASLRNPLTHFRHIDDSHNLDRRSIATGQPAGELLGRDAWFAISLAVRMLAKPPFRLDQ